MNTIVNCSKCLPVSFVFYHSKEKSMFKHLMFVGNIFCRQGLVQGNDKGSQIL